jgi:hypothetical protein
MIEAEFWCKHAVQNTVYGVRRKTVPDIRKTESDPQNAYSVLIQRALAVLQNMDQGKT